MAITKIGSRAIIDGSILAADFAPGTVTSAKLTDSTIANNKLSNSGITIAGESVSLGGTVNLDNLTDWQSKITSDGSTVTTMVSGRGYFVDNSSAAGLVKLPASASRGDFVQIKDYAGNFGTNNLTIQRNSHNIQGVANDSSISTNRASVVLVYVDSTKGWLYTDEHNVASLENKLYVEATGGTVTTSGDYKIHTFTGDGNFVVSSVGNAAGSNTVDYMVVAGGGAGGAYYGAGGGGAGGFRESVPSPAAWTASPIANPGGALPVSAQAYPITIGGGGAARGAPCGIYTPANAGSNSVFSTITSAGGGGGNCVNAPDNPAGSGGSGGGVFGSVSGGTGGAGNTPPVSPPQGNPGGNSNDYSPEDGAIGSGGGGATASGAAGRPGTGNGGAGATTLISGSSTAYAGGGGGGGSPQQSGKGSGGSGGGGNGGPGSPPGLPGPAMQGAGGTGNTGGGGGGGGGNSGAGGNGGSGVVLIRYKYQN